jgi:hypothetical protein
VHRAPRRGNKPSRRHAAHFGNLLNAMTILLLDQTPLDCSELSLKAAEVSRRTDVGNIEQVDVT